MDKKIHFPKGLIGLENYHDFMLSELPDQTQFWLLQSLEDEHFGLVITNPFWFMPNYDFELVTVNVAVIPENITANLMGPIILNQSTGIGFQTLIADKRYTTQYKLMSAKLIGG